MRFIRFLSCLRKGQIVLDHVVADRGDMHVGGQHIVPPRVANRRKIVGTDRCTVQVCVARQ